jgi:SAM-dependent methyltransferase
LRLAELKKNWNEFGRRDPLWSILAAPDKKNKSWELDEFFKTGEQDVEAILKYIKELPFHLRRGRALDFGCGVGRLTQALCTRFDDCYGVDIARSMIRLARKLNRHAEKCRYVLNERNDLRLFKSGSFDFICTLITLQHMEPAYSKNYIREFLRVLAPEGMLFFQLPAALTPSNPLLNQKPPEVEARSADDGRGGIRGLYQKAVALYRDRLRSASFEPVMEMHVVPKEDVFQLVQESGGKVVAVQDDFSCGDDWRSFRYFVTK